MEARCTTDGIVVTESLFELWRGEGVCIEAAERKEATGFVPSVLNDLEDLIEDDWDRGEDDELLWVIYEIAVLIDAPVTKHSNRVSFNIRRAGVVN